MLLKLVTATKQSILHTNVHESNKFFHLIEPEARLCDKQMQNVPVIIICYCDDFRFRKMWPTGKYALSDVITSNIINRLQ